MKFRACSTFSDRHITLLECQKHFELVQDPVYGNFSLGVAHLIAENYQDAENYLLLSKNDIPLSYLNLAILKLKLHKIGKPPEVNRKSTGSWYPNNNINFQGNPIQ